MKLSVGMQTFIKWGIPVPQTGWFRTCDKKYHIAVKCRALSLEERSELEINPGATVTKVVTEAICVHRLATERPWSEDRVGPGRNLKKLHWLTGCCQGWISKRDWEEMAQEISEGRGDYMAWGRPGTSGQDLLKSNFDHIVTDSCVALAFVSTICFR